VPHQDGRRSLFRYIRPGAVRVGATSVNNSVFVSAYEHAGAGTNTIVLANTSTSAQSVTVVGVPDGHCPVAAGAIGDHAAGRRYSAGDDQLKTDGLMGKRLGTGRARPLFI
jgi:hypothetical protein